MKRLLPLLLATLAAFAQQGPVKPKNAFDKATLEAYLRHMELWIPQVNVAIGDPKPSTYLQGFSEVTVQLSYGGQKKEERYYISKDGASIVKGVVYDINRNPFQENLDKLRTGRQPSFGAAGAPVSIVVFADFQCPYCKAEAEALRQNVSKTFPSDVRVYFKDFPLESIHPWARAASIAGRCVYQQNELSFWKFHDWIYEVQGEITPENLSERVLGWAPGASVDATALNRCMETKATGAEVAANVAEGQEFGIDGTPALFLNGRKLPTGVVEWPVLEQLIKLELAHLEAN